jgi:hypothetical protein
MFAAPSAERNFFLNVVPPLLNLKVPPQWPLESPAYQSKHLLQFLCELDRFSGHTSGQREHFLEIAVGPFA